MFADWSSSFPTIFFSKTHDEIDEEIEALELALWRIIGAVPAILRPPCKLQLNRRDKQDKGWRPHFVHSHLLTDGEANEEVVQYLNNKHDLTVVNWDVDSRDSAGATPEASIAALSGFKFPDPHLPLMHETYQTSVENVTSNLLPIYRKQGYKM